MNDGVPGDDAAESAVLHVQGSHRTLVEPQARVRPTGHRNHRRRQIDAERAQPERVQVCRHASGAATEIGDRPGIGGPHEFGERGKHGTVQWLPASSVRRSFA